ncbi:23S rRNA (cytidine-2'-O)-methyltransferase TlyA [Sulfurospirillum barnesii]|uniref:Hemolysin A n=1 Tax=Sulfurospirillum barnesii (strain ATCC 700032 / DSM 10660 / SES-3) TaxID=760154 RepID=I3XXP6_SULBS|nr:TlyA family RNA methyltransferase [Sulfurospirillum barnesii]AFL68720.1 hemolysin A [Sulfurospirillum barnesii SES-3]
MRLDSYLFEKGLAQSRNKASELIKEGSVWLNGKVERKSSVEVSENDTVDVAKITQYVSRAGLKLRGFINELGLHVKGLDVLDIGSSTGGFVQVWLEEDAHSVTAVDVGSEQLHPSLRVDNRIISHENTDIRLFNPNKTYDMVSCDVSFIGIGTLLEHINRLAKNEIIILFKPQFEVGKDVKRTTKGVVKDGSAILRAHYQFEAQTISLGWELREKKESLVKGKEGNVETFYYFKKREC